MNVETGIALATTHVNGNASAQLCLDDAKSLVEKGFNDRFVLARCLASLTHSVGIFHPDYLKVRQALEEAKASSISAPA